MDDTTVLKFNQPLATIGANSPWRVVASPDVNGDGTPDLLWWNSSTGALLVWDIQGVASPSVLSYGATFAKVAPSTGYQPVAAGDVDGHGKWSLIWENMKTGQILRWKMTGTTVDDYGTVYAQVPPAWKVVAAADFNGDGHSDLLFWNSQTGQLLCWLMNDTTVLSYGQVFATVSHTTWHLVGAPDMNGDGHPDLLWENFTTGDVERWLMDDTTVLSYGSTFTSFAPSTGWELAGMR